MPLSAISAPPRYIVQDADAPTERETPATYVNLPPVLRTILENATIVLDPGLPVATSSASPQWQAQGTLYVTNDALSFLDPSANKGFTVDFPTISLHAVSLSLPPALESMASTSGSNACLYCQFDDSAGQEDDEDQDMQGDEDEEEQAQDQVRELWFLPEKPEQLEPLYEMLSYCASLHPSLGTEDGAAGGNPFASFGAFGSGSEGMLGVGGPVLDLSALSAEGAFEDAMEDDSGGAGVNGHSGVNGVAGSGTEGLSESGRAVLDRLEASINWPTEFQSGPSSSAIPPPSSNETSNHKKSNVSNTLILTSLPESLFEAPELLSSLLDLLHAYGPLASWTPLPSMGRALVVFEDGIEAPGIREEGTLSRGQESAKRAKGALDKLLWGFEDEGAPGPQQGLGEDDEVMEWPPRKAEGREARNGSAMRVYFGPPSSVLLASDSEDALAVPSTDKNFLISPPGSPPVGWEPIREDPPNRDTLAWDLMKALGELRDQGGAVNSWKAAPLGDGNDAQADRDLQDSAASKGSPILSGSDGLHQDSGASRTRSHARKGSLGPPSLVIPPSEAKISRRQASSPGAAQPRPTPYMTLVAEAQGEASSGQAGPSLSVPGTTDGNAEEDSVMISVPGVTVQAFEDDSDDENAELRARRQPRTGMSISSVKATVESMFSSTSSPAAAAAAPLPDAKGPGGAADSKASDVTGRMSGLSLGTSLGEYVDGNAGGKRITPTSRPPLV